MKIFRALIMLTILVAWGFSAAAGAHAQDGLKNPLKEVSFDSHESELAVRLEFAKPILGDLHPVFAGGSVQIDIPDAEARLDRLYYPTGDEVIRRVLVTRLDERTLRVELPLGVEPGESRPVTIVKQGRVVELKVDKTPLADPLSSFLEKAREEVNAQVALPAAPPAAEEKPAAAALPQVEVKDKKPPVRFSEPAVKSESLEILPSSLKMLTMLALVLGLMFVLFYGFKKFVLKGTPFGRYDRWVRVLGTSFLGPKKSIALVEVAGEVLVLGIANDHISLLSRIDDAEKIERITSGAPPARRVETGNGHAAKEAANGNGHKAKETANGNGHMVGEGDSDFDDILRASVSPKEQYVRDVTDQIRRKLEKIRPE